MTEKPITDTIEKAFKSSLGKWKRIRNFSRDLFNEIDTNCGFCDYTVSLSDLRNRKDCEECPVKKRCDKILAKSVEIQEQIDELIDSTISFLEKKELDQNDG